MKQQSIWIGICAIILVVPRPAHGQVTALQPGFDSTNWPAGVAKKSELPEARAYEYEFSDVSISQIEKWVSWIGVEIPVDVSGALSGWVWAQRSESGWFNFAGYRVEGQISSPAIRVEQWEFRDANLRFGYANDRWYIGSLTGEVTSAGGSTAIGQANFAATLPQSAPRLLQVLGQIDQAQIKPLLQAFGIELDITNDTGTVIVNANVPLDRASEPGAWQATASVDVNGVRSQHIPRSSLTGKIAVDDGQWRTSDTALTILDQPLDLNGRGSVEGYLPFEVTLRGSQLSIAELLKAGKQPELASRLVGAVDLVGTMRGGLERGIESASAAARSSSIRIDNETIEAVLIDGIFDNRQSGKESLAVEIQSVSIAGGTLQGAVRWDSLRSVSRLIPDVASVQLANVDLSRLPRLISPVPLSGVANGKVAVSSTLIANDKTHAWRTDGDLTVAALSILGIGVGDASLQFEKPADSNHLQARIGAAQGAVKADVDLALEASHGFPEGISNYSAVGRVTEFDALVPLAAASGESIPLTITGNFDVQGSPQNWLAGGKAELAQVLVKLDAQDIELRDLIVNVQKEAFRLERFTLSDARGRIAGSALIRRNGIGEHLLNLRIADVEIEPYVNKFAPTEFHGVAGKLYFESRLKKSATTADFVTDWTGTFVGDIAEVNYRTTPVGQVAIHGTMNGTKITANAQGDVLGGKLEMDGNIVLDDFLQNAPDIIDNTDAKLPFKASLTGVQLNRLTSVAFGPRLGQQYTGTADLEIKSGNSTDTGLHVHFAVPSFHYQRQELANDLFAELRFREGRLLVQKLTGGMADGRVNVRGDVQMVDGQPNGGLQFTANSMQLKGLVAFILPEYADNFSGIVTYRGRARLGTKVAVTGNSHFKDLSVYGLPIQEVRNELHIDLTPSGELIVLSARNAHGTALGGRFDGEASLRGGARFGLEAQGKIGNGKLDQLGRALGFEHIVGTGNFSASTRLSSVDAIDISALNGPVQLDFENGDASSVPILSDISRLVPVIQLASTDIKSGTMHGQLGQGQLRINDLLLVSDAFWLVADGSASLKTNHLDFDALLQTGGGIDDQLLQAGAEKLLAVALPQLALLNELNNLASSRTVYFHIGGTAKHPVIQPKAAQTAAKALLQNVSRQLLIAPTAVPATGKD